MIDVLAERVRALYPGYAVTLTQHGSGWIARVARDRASHPHVEPVIASSLTDAVRRMAARVGAA